MARSRFASAVVTLAVCGGCVVHLGTEVELPDVRAARVFIGIQPVTVNGSGYIPVQRG